jgi:hypothetical protein
MNVIDDTLPEPKWMNGSGGTSKKTYMVVARRGDICLGLKLEGLQPGEQVGVPGKTYLLFRVRSARHPELFEAEDAGKKVVALTGNLGLDEAWPDFAFEKVGHDRASAGVGVFIKGSLLSEPAAFCQHFVDSDFVGRCVDYVLERAGADNVVLPREVIVETFTGKLDVLFAKVKDWHDQYHLAQAIEQEMQAKIEDDIGTVGQQASQLKAIYDKHAAAYGANKQLPPSPPSTLNID